MAKDTRILDYVKKNTKRNKLMKILEYDANSNQYIPYPLDDLTDEEREWYISQIESNKSFFGKMLKNMFQLNFMGKKMGKDYNRLDTQFFEANMGQFQPSKPDGKVPLYIQLKEVQNPVEELLNRKNVTTEDLFFIIQNNIISKEDALRIIKTHAENNNIIIPPANLEMGTQELEDLLLDIYRKKYASEFAEIEFNNNPLFNEKLMKMLDNRAFILDENDIIDESNKVYQHLRFNRELVIEVVKSLYLTGNISELIKNTTVKQKEINIFLDNKFDFLSEKGQDESKEEYAKRITDWIIQKINELDIENNVDDRVEFIKLSRHYLNKYTKEIQKFEDGILDFYVDVDSVKEQKLRNGYREKELEEFNNTITREKGKKIDEIIDFIFEENLYVNGQWKSGSENEVTNSFINANSQNANAGRNVYENKALLQKTILKFLVDKYECNVIYKNQNFNFIKNKDRYRELIIKLFEIKENGRDNNEIERIKLELKECFSVNENVKEKALDNVEKEWLNKLRIARDKFYKIQSGVSNNNLPPLFGTVVERYLDYKKKNPNATYEDFAKDESGTETDYIFFELSDMYKALEDAVDEIKKHDFFINPDLLIKNMSVFLERKNKIYNIKHLNTLQLFAKRDKMIFGKLKTDDEKAINIGFEDSFELFGGHYVDGDPENNIENMVSNYGRDVAQMYKVLSGRVHIPFPKVTAEQKEEFIKLSDFIKIIEENGNDASLEGDFSENDKKRFNELKAEYIYYKNYENRKKDIPEPKYLALKVQILLGAGLDRFKEFFNTNNYLETRDVVRNEEKDEKIVELERRLQEAEEQNRQKDEKITELTDKNAELERLLQEERESHSLTKKALVSAQDIIKSVFGFVDKVKSSVFGKFFFGKAIKELPEAKIEEDSDKEER